MVRDFVFTEDCAMEKVEKRESKISALSTTALLLYDRLLLVSKWRHISEECSRNIFFSKTRKWDILELNDVQGKVKQVTEGLGWRSLAVVIDLCPSKDLFPLSRRM